MINKIVAEHLEEYKIYKKQISDMRKVSILNQQHDNSNVPRLKDTEVQKTIEKRDTPQPYYALNKADRDFVEREAIQRLKNTTPELTDVEIQQVLKKMEELSPKTMPVDDWDN